MITCSLLKAYTVSTHTLIMKANEMHYFSNLFDIVHVFNMFTVHHQEYLNTVYMQQVFLMLVLLASASRSQQN